MNSRVFLSRFIPIAILLTLVGVSPSPGQVVQGSVGNNRTLELVDHLKELIHSAERDRRSSYWLTRQLRELVRRYDWPWRASLLHDDFRDGDYEYNPHWVVSRGDFWVTRASALRSVFDLPSQDRRVADGRGESPAIDILHDILWGRNGNERGETQTSPSAAEIYTRLPISNAFAARLNLVFGDNRDGDNRLEFGPFQGDARDSGYRLVYASGHVPSFTLVRAAPGRSAVVEIYDRAVNVEDGSPHTVEWHRRIDGEMVVFLDEKEIIRTVDRAYSDGFDGFTLMNRGGAYELRDISIFGTRQ